MYQKVIAYVTRWKVTAFGASLMELIFQTSHAAKCRKKGQELDFSWYNYAVSYLQSLLRLNVLLYPESVQKGFVVVVLLFF